MVSAYITYRNHPSLVLAQTLASQLTNKRIQVYLAPEDKSVNYREQYPTIEQADVFICVIAEGTFEPRWVPGTVQYAHSLSKPIIPVYQGNFEPLASSYPDYIQFLLAQDGFKISSVTSEIVDQIVARIYAEVGKIPGNQILIPNQYIFLSYSRRDSEIMN